MLLAGELSPAEYAARVVAPPSLRFVSPRYRPERRVRSSSRRLVRVRILLLTAFISGSGAMIAMRLGLPRGVVVASVLMSTISLVLTALFVATSGIVQENWFLNHEVRHQRGQVDAYSAYGETLVWSLRALAKGAETGGVTADFIRGTVESLRTVMSARGHDDVILAILRREFERYLVVYLALPNGSPYESRIKRTGVDAAEFFTCMGSEVFSQVVAFDLSDTEHELVAVSTDPFGPPEEWALRQVAAYCSAVGALARL